MPLPKRTTEGLASRLPRLSHGTWEEALAYGVSILLGSPVTPARCLESLWIICYKIYDFCFSLNHANQDKRCAFVTSRDLAIIICPI